MKTKIHYHCNLFVKDCRRLSDDSDWETVSSVSHAEHSTPFPKLSRRPFDAKEAHFRLSDSDVMIAMPVKQNKTHQIRPIK